MEKRPLYDAIKKYGIEHFHIEQIEECSLEDVAEREKYWIEYYHSFKDGYNATIGGDGTIYLDYELITKTYNQLLSVRKTAKFLHIDNDSVTRALLATNSYTLEEIKRNGEMATATPVGQYDLAGNLIAVYPSIMAAETAVHTGRHISAVCHGKRKTAGGFIWKFI